MTQPLAAPLPILADRAPSPPALPKDFLSVLDFSPAALDRCLTLAARLKQERRRGRRGFASRPLAGAHVALLFEKPSLRTRSTFEIAVRELGGEVLEPHADAVFGSRETPADIARNLERWVSAVVFRTFAQRRLVEFAQATRELRVINALSDQEHPCQALADMLTLRERWSGSLEGRRIAYVGDGNNVATSLVHAAVMLGITVHVASPARHRLPSRVVADARRVGRDSGGCVRLFDDPRDAVAGCAAVYTDTWTSMGQEAEAAERRAVFAPFQVNDALMARAEPGALFMHCLPAHRGEEVTDSVIDADISVVFEQAENRLHAQKALLLMLLDCPA
jgi:ornithine carbamoyltransferase